MVPLLLNSICVTYQCIRNILLRACRTKGPNEIGDHRSWCVDSQVLMTSMFSRASHLFHCYDASCRYVLKAAAAARTGDHQHVICVSSAGANPGSLSLPSVSSSDVRPAHLRE